MRSVTLDEAIGLQIDKVLRGVNTMLPGEVISFKSSPPSVEARIQIKRKVGSRFVEVSKLVNVPIMYPSSSKASITFPLFKGDTVLCFFAARSIDEWLEGSKNAEPLDDRKFSYSDAFAFPGGRNNREPLDVDPEAVTVKADKIKLGSTGASEAYVLGDAQRTELNKILNQMSTLITALSGWTPVPLDGGLALKTILTASGLFALPPSNLTNTLSDIIDGE